MADATKKKGLGLPQTKGSFQVRGRVDGTQKEKFYIEKLTSSNKPWRSVSFGVQFADEKSIYVGLNGMEKEKVWFSKKGEDGAKPETKEVPWKDRFTFAEEGFSLIGTNIGVKKVLDAKGNEVNDRKRLTEYDACKEISDNLKDGSTVFVKGAIEFSQYNGKHSTKFVPSQVSLGKDIDFDAEDFVPTAEFTQYIVFMGIEPNKEKTRATLEAKIVNYDSIEDAEFIVEDMNFARVLSKNLKPYTGIKVWGTINVEKNTEEVETKDCWGSANKMEVQKAPMIRELIITGADPESIDKDTYSEKEIDKAIETMKASKQAEDDFGGTSGGWGSLAPSDNNDEESGW